MPSRRSCVSGFVASALAAWAGVAHGQALARPPRTNEVVWVDPVRDVAPDARAAEISKILYVNRCIGDCVLMAGDNDARMNTSSIVRGTTTVSEFAYGDDVYDEVIDCLRDVYGPYDVEVVTEDPGPGVFHHEAILAGTPEEIGLNPNVGGVAPASCDPLNNVISFSFANIQGTDAETMCWTVAQESAHSFGLPNHVYDCLDPMTYLPGPCGRKYFRNRGIRCGEFDPVACVCGVSEQNSHAKLLAAFGPGTPPDPPEVSLLYPPADAEIDDGFSVFFTATDPRLVKYADLYYNGTKYATVAGHDFAQRDQEYSTAAPELPDGYIDVEIRAYNEINEDAGTATVRVLKGAPCTSADQCFDFMSCNAGRCEYPAPTGQLGDECPYDAFCQEGTCTERDGEHRCSQSCNVNVTDDACPDGLECVSPGICWESGGGGGGGCGAAAGDQGGDDSAPLVLLSLLAGALVVTRRGRRRPHASRP